MELYDVVMKLVGPVLPVGEHHEDSKRFENITRLTALVDTLLCEIRDASSAADRPEASMKKIGIHARAFLHDITAL